MEEGLRFRGSGEGDLAPTRYEWGGIGRGVEPCFTDAFVWNVRGSYSSTPAIRLLGLGLCTEGRG